jgi:hypothetical protein
MEAVLTTDEVASFLRTDPPNVQQLLDSGKLAGFKVAGEWRIVSPAILDYLRREMADAQEKVLFKAASDPRFWADVLRDAPDIADMVNGQEYAEGTMGALLQAALLVDEQLQTAENVVPFERPPQH